MNIYIETQYGTWIFNAQNWRVVDKLCVLTTNTFHGNVSAPDLYIFTKISHVLWFIKLSTFTRGYHYSFLSSSIFSYVIICMGEINMKVSADVSVGWSTFFSSRWKCHIISAKYGGQLYNIILRDSSAKVHARPRASMRIRREIIKSSVRVV